MSDTNKNTVGNTHQGKDMPMTGEYTGFFNGLMEIVEKGGELSEQTGTAIGRYVMEWPAGIRWTGSTIIRTRRTYARASADAPTRTGRRW